MAGRIASAAPLLSSEQQEMAFALACQLIHRDRIVAPEEQPFLVVLAQQLQFTTARAEQILVVCALLNRDFVAEQAEADQTATNGPLRSVAS